MTDTAGDSATAIAVIGMAIRCPGAADVEQFWANLVAGVESISIADAPADHVAAAGVVDGIDQFDAALFGCTPRQAAEMDPQHRVFLECAWTALESAGYPPRGAPLRAGVYAGAALSTYLLSHLVPAAERVGASALDEMTGFAVDYLATRVAYELDLTGPAMTVQTACSTSLVAIHAACQALIAGECELALAGGVALRLPQLAPYRYQEGGILSPDGHCRAFDARAAGTVPGNGAGVVVLKRLADALADRDPIRAVVLGTAINNDGRAKAGFTAPSVAGQAIAISDALAVAGVSPSEIGYVEAHGTATPLGDPIELAGLARAFAGAPRGSCGLGSVKTNLGHLDTAAGVAGFVKAVLALEHGVVPPSLHFTAPNPELRIERSPFFVVRERCAWPGPRPRRAGVSSFGLGGTNAHVIVQEAPEVIGEPAPPRDELIVISAQTRSALDQVTARLAGAVEHTAAAVADIAHTLQVGRTRFAHRRCVVARDRDELAAALRRAVDEPMSAAVMHDREPVFVFPGGGVQRVTMAAELVGEPRFDAAFDDCAAAVRAQLGPDLRRLVFAGAGESDAQRLDTPVISQVAIFACDWAIAQQWLAWGVAPRAVLGHSLGEYAAACLAGVFSLDQALRLVIARGEILERLPASAMVSVLAAPAQLAPLLGDALSIGAINGPARCLVSGETAAVARFEARLADAGIEHRRLRYARASHSALLDPHLPGFERLVADCAPRPPTLPMVSSVTGAWLAADEARDPRYWSRQFRAPVQFSDAIATLLAAGRRAVIEAGPGGTLSALVRQHPAAAGHAVITTSPLPSAGSAPRRALAALGEAWIAGVPVDWARLRAGERRRRVALPTYCFDRERHWIEAAATASTGGPSHAAEATSATARDDHAVAPARNATEQALVACWQDLFGVAPVGIHDDFFARGGDSLLAVRLMAMIARRLDVRLALRAIAEAPTIAALAARIAAPNAAPGPSCLVRLQHGARTPPVFFVHAGGGHAVFYRDLARAIDPDRAMYGFEARGLDGREPFHASVEDMARHYAELARSVHPAGPYLLVGASFGGMIAYEMARQLAAHGHAVPLCALLDTPGPGYLPAAAGDEADLLAFYLDGLVAVSAAALRGRSLDDQLRDVLAAAEATGGALPFADLEAGRRLVAAWRHHGAVMERYTAPAWTGGELQFFAAAERDERFPRHLERAWIGRCAVRVETAPGDHRTMVIQPHATALGAQIRRCLAARYTGTL